MSGDYFIQMTLEFIKDVKPEEAKEPEKVRCIEKNWNRVVEYMRSLDNDARNSRS